MAIEKAPEIAVQEPVVVVYDNGVETFTSRIAALRSAQKLFSTYSQEQVDQIFLATAMATNRQWTPLVKLAVAGTGMGVVGDRVIKNHYAPEYIYNVYKNTKACDALERDTSFGIQTIAKPIGVVAAVISTTNPTPIAILRTLLCLKTQNATFICPHPRAKESTIATARVVLNTAVAAGVPKGIITWIDVPSVGLINQAMKEADLILVTGDPGTVQTAYSSGKPAIDVGTGNTPAIADDSADLILAVNSTIHSRTFDNGIVCTSEQSVIVPDGVHEQVKAEFAARGCYLLNPDETKEVRRTILINGALNSKVISQSAYAIVKLSGLNIPENTEISIGEVESVEPQEALTHKKLSPALAMYRAKDFADTIQKAERLVADGGYGHISSLYINTVAKPEELRLFTAAMRICRVLINAPITQGGIGDLYSFKLPPSLALSCDSWGGNSVSENVDIRHLLNIKTVAERRENMSWFRTPEKIYLKWGCLPVALGELKDVLNKKRVFLVTDEFLFRDGYTKSITDRLDKLGIAHTTFFDVQPDPILHCTKKGAVAMKVFMPSYTIALGDGSMTDAAKIMWTMYEHPGVDFMGLVMRFMDIRKQMYIFPKMDEKAYLAAIPTSAGTGSEVTPFAVITDEVASVKYLLTDYELMFKIAIVDVDLMTHMSRGLTAASDVDVTTHALETYAVILATDCIDGLTLKVLKNTFTYPPWAYEHGAADPVARERMTGASTMAGMAFANAFLDIRHSVAHKLGALCHLPHGVANALMITYVMCLNADPRPTKIGTFPQYRYPHTLKRYRECADSLGIPGKDEGEKSNGLIAVVEELKIKIGIPKSIQVQGADEAAFLAALDGMTKHAFDDQCTGANPRYPPMSEIRQMYLDAYYGE